MTKEFEATIPFQGFYGSIHSDQIDGVLEMEINDHFEDKEYSQDAADAWYDTISYSELYRAYSIQYVAFVKDELGLSSLAFDSLISPRTYNFTNDRIICTLSQKDVIELHSLYINSDVLKSVLKDKYTHCDGFTSFYSNNVEDWQAKDLSIWDLNEVGSLIRCHWREEGTQERDVFDYGDTPIHETIMNALPYIGDLRND